LRKNVWWPVDPICLDRGSKLVHGGLPSPGDDQMGIITSDMRAVIQAAHLCFAATVTPEGRPNLSPKGTIRVWDDDHIFFLDIASPGTRTNLASNPLIEVNVVEQLSRRGYRFFGRAKLHRDDDVFREATNRVFGEEGAKYPVEAVVLIEVERAESLSSPGYLHIRTEEEMRSTWRKRRAALDDEFEMHVAKEPFRP
jgi:predicted pyridoxine 5'-phosphate oxidase superfamily flavin-nucleotide-binding protein